LQINYWNTHYSIIQKTIVSLSSLIKVNEDYINSSNVICIYLNKLIVAVIVNYIL